MKNINVSYDWIEVTSYLIGAVFLTGIIYFFVQP